MPFTTRDAYDAQRLLHDLVLAPRDPLQLHAQTLLNKYNMHPNHARTLASQKLKTEFGRIFASVAVKRMPVVVPPPPPRDPEPEPEPEPEPKVKSKPAPAKKGKPDPKAANKTTPKAQAEEEPPAAAQREEPPEVQHDNLTEADKTGDLRSTWRALDRPLWLLVQDGYGFDGKSADTWRFPHAEMIPGENIRQTAERAVASTTHNGLDALYELDSPCGHTVLPSGDHLFYVRATVRGGGNGRPMDKVQLTLESGLKDHAWVAKEDLPVYVTDQKLLEAASKLCV